MLSAGTSFIDGAFNPENGQEQFYFAPSWGFGYTIRLSEMWGLATKNDIEFLNLEVADTRSSEDEERTNISRENVFVFTAGVLFIPIERVGVYVGGGAEIDRNETLPTATLTLEYGLLKQKAETSEWTAGIEASYHYKQLYSSFNLGLGISFGWW